MLHARHQRTRLRGAQMPRHQRTRLRVRSRRAYSALNIYNKYRIGTDIRPTDRQTITTYIMFLTIQDVCVYVLCSDAGAYSVFVIYI